MSNALRALLIDDEPRARHVLRLLLSAHPEVTITGESGDIDEAATLLAAGGYEIVFLDVQLLGGTGFDLMPHVSPDARVIFVTAFDQHAIRAFEVNALDYLLKPVLPVRLGATLARLAALTPEPAAPSVARITDLAHLRLDGDRQRFVPLADLAAVSSDQNYSEAWLADGERLFVRKTMKAWETLLPSAHFVRVHRQTIVNVAHLRAIERSTDDTSLLTIQGCPEPVRASYRYLPELRAQLAAADRKV